jgi:hypothetical protein
MCVSLQGHKFTSCVWIYFLASMQFMNMHVTILWLFACAHLRGFTKKKLTGIGRQITNTQRRIYIQSFSLSQYSVSLSPSLWRNRLESDCGSEGMGFDPHTGQSKMKLFSLSIITDKIVLLHQLVRWCQYNVTSRS